MVFFDIIRNEQMENQERKKKEVKIDYGKNEKL